MVDRAPVQILGIDHVQVAAPAGCEQAARAFYGGLLGLDELPKPPLLEARGGCWFRAGAQELHVGVEEPVRAGAEGASELLSSRISTALAGQLRGGGLRGGAGRGDPRRRARLRGRSVRQPARAAPGLTRSACVSISVAYGYASAAGVLRGGRAQVVLPGGRAPRGHPARRLAAGAVAREAARDAAPRPLRPPRRADRGRAPALPRRAAAAAARGGHRRRASRRRRPASSTAPSRSARRPGRAASSSRSSSASSRTRTRSCTSPSASSTRRR